MQALAGEQLIVGSLAPVTPWVAGLGVQEMLLLLVVLLLLVGGSKLPELARGTGRALRIFKAETRGLTDDSDSNMQLNGSQQGSGAGMPDEST